MEPWTKLSEERVYSGYKKVDRVRYRFPDGTEHDIELTGPGKAICALALTPDNQVILARQFRAGHAQILDEMPGGAIDADETPEAAITRELREETGYVGDIEYVGFTHVSPYDRLKHHVCVAKNCRRVSHPEPEQGERIEVVKKPLAEFRQQLQYGSLTDTHAGYMALDHLGLL